jgi:hypothetical protein
MTSLCEYVSGKTREKHGSVKTLHLVLKFIWIMDNAGITYNTNCSMFYENQLISRRVHDVQPNMSHF